MLKTLLFLIVVYFAVRWISRLFLSPGNKKSGNFRFFYQTFKNVREQQKQQQNSQQRQHTTNGKVPKDELDNIEEAEYEDITEENSDK